MLNKLKSLLLFILIFTITILSYNSQRVYALDGRTYVTIAEAAAITAETAISTGTSIAVAPFVIGTLVIGAGLYAGYKVVDKYGPVVTSKVSDMVKTWDKTKTNDYIYQYSKNGKKYVGLTESGLSYSQEYMKNIANQKDMTIDSTYKTTNTIDDGVNPFNRFDYYMLPFNVGANGSVYYTFNLTSKSQLFVSLKGSDGAFMTATYKGSNISKVVIRQVGSEAVVNIEYQSGGSINNFKVPSVGQISIGYKATPDVTANINDVVENVKPVSIPVGDSISVPVTSSDIETMTYLDTSISPNTITQDKYNTQNVTQTLYDTNTDTSPEGGTNTAPNLDLDVPSKDIPKLDFSPLMVATQKFPFCIPWDLWSSYKVFEGNSTPFAYEFKEINLNGTITGGQSITVLPNFKIDFAEYPSLDVAVQIFKYLQLLLFIVMLILKTRSLIRG